MNRRLQPVVWILVVTCTLLVTVVAAAFHPYRQSNQEANHHSYLPVVFNTMPGPTILYFRANVPTADPGDTILLEWESLGATSASLARIEPGGPIAEWWEVEPSGRFTYTIKLSERNFVHFALTVQNDYGAMAGQYLFVPLNCPDTWFFSPAPDGCPLGPALYSGGAEQPFEDGFMVWVEEQDAIYVLFDDDVFSPRWAMYADTWQEGDPLCDPGPIPPGVYQPQRGFGKVWCEEAEVRERLGWATQLETGYDTAIQDDSAPKYTTRYIRAADGNVWKLLPERSGWEKIILPATKGSNHDKLYLFTTGSTVPAV